MYQLVLKYDDGFTSVIPCTSYQDALSKAEIASNISSEGPQFSWSIEKLPE